MKFSLSKLVKADVNMQVRTDVEVHPITPVAERGPFDKVKRGNHGRVPQWGTGGRG